MLLSCFIIVISRDTLYHGVMVIVCALCVSFWLMSQPSSAFMVIVWDNLVWGNTNFEECFVALRMISVRFPLENCLEWHIEVSICWFNYVILLRVSK
jgi:hypothetical protein